MHLFFVVLGIKSMLGKPSITVLPIPSSDLSIIHSLQVWNDHTILHKYAQLITIIILYETYFNITMYFLQQKYCPSNKISNTA
jgi:hypothetical protein